MSLPTKLPLAPQCRNYSWRGIHGDAPAHGCSVLGECKPIQNGPDCTACPEFVGERQQAAARQSLPCAHLGEPTGAVSPSTCCGQTEIPIHACAVHDTCTTERVTSDVACCNGCTDRQAIASPLRPIPKVFHRVWLGTNAMPDEYAEYGRRWLALHPGWEMWVWNENNIGPLRVQECAAWAQTRNHSQRSDVIRFAALLFYGGVYVDTDVEPVKNLEPLLAGHSFVAGREDARHVCTAVIASAPGHPIMRRATELLNGGIPADASSSYTGPPILTRAVRGQAASILSPAFFYPYHWSEPQRKGEHFPDAYAVHHWAGSWK